MRHSNAPMLQRIASPCLFRFRQSSQPQPLRAICRPHHHATRAVLAQLRIICTCLYTCAPSCKAHGCKTYIHNVSKLAQYIMLHRPRASWATGKCVGAWGRMRGRIACEGSSKSRCWIGTEVGFVFSVCVWLGFKLQTSKDFKGLWFLRCLGCFSRRLPQFELPKEY